MMIFHSYVSLPEGIYANMTGYIDGIHGTPYIAAPWIRHGNDKYGVGVLDGIRPIFKGHLL